MQDLDHLLVERSVCSRLEEFTESRFELTSTANLGIWLYTKQAGINFIDKYSKTCGFCVIIRSTMQVPWIYISEFGSWEVKSKSRSPFTGNWCSPSGKSPTRSSAYILQSRRLY